MHKDLFFTFVDLEKAYDRVPRDLVYWCLRRRGVSENLVRLVEATYHGASTVVRTMHGRTDEFPIQLGLHQGLGLSPFLFIVVLDVISEELRRGLSCELQFADDLAVVTDTELGGDVQLAVSASFSFAYCSRRYNFLWYYSFNIVFSPTLLLPIAQYRLLL